MTSETSGTGGIRDRVMDAVEALDGVALRREVHEGLSSHGVDAVVVEVLVPALHAIGAGWESGELGVVHEHFASSAFRGTLGELRAPVPGGRDRTVVLACPPHELHDLPLELFGAMLHARRWRVVSLGANTPMTALADAVRFLRADAVVLAAVRPAAFASRLTSLSRLGASVPLFLAGQAAAALAEAPRSVHLLPEDLYAAARVVDAVPAARERAVPTPAMASGIR